MIRFCGWFQWLKKQADARKVIETADADLSEEERNPMFLTDKAESVFTLIDVKIHKVYVTCPHMLVCCLRSCLSFFSKFFKAGDLQAAINAYSTGIRLNPQIPAYP